MNVREGDLAVVVTAIAHPANVGAWVTVERRLDAKRWTCRALTAIYCDDGRMAVPGKFVSVLDDILRPIRGQRVKARGMSEEA